MTSATIKLFLPRGDAKSLRTAGIANGLTAWKTDGGKSLKQLDEQA